MFVLFYTVQIVYIRLFITCSTSYCFWHTYGTMECIYVHESMYVCIYACMLSPRSANWQTVL